METKVRRKDAYCYLETTHPNGSFLIDCVNIIGEISGLESAATLLL